MNIAYVNKTVNLMRLIKYFVWIFYIKCYDLLISTLSL